MCITTLSSCLPACRKNPKDRREQALDDVLDAFSALGKSVHHMIGNHWCVARPHCMMHGIWHTALVCLSQVDMPDAIRSQYEMSEACAVLQLVQLHEG